MDIKRLYVVKWCIDMSYYQTFIRTCLCIDMCGLVHLSDSVLVVWWRGRCIACLWKHIHEHICEPWQAYLLVQMHLSLCVQAWVSLGVHVLLLDLAGSEAFWTNAPKDECHVARDLAPGGWHPTRLSAKPICRQTLAQSSPQNIDQTQNHVCWFSASS